MYLVDTSVWISYFKDEKNEATASFSALLDKHASFGITGIIYQEILQGAASEKDFARLAEYLETQKFYHPKDSIETYQAAAKIYFSCRKKGLTIRSAVDCLIAQIAVDNDLVLLHNDRDYLKIAKINSHLKLL